MGIRYYMLWLHVVRNYDALTTVTILQILERKLKGGIW
jgi:hypothetical protein